MKGKQESCREGLMGSKGRWDEILTKGGEETWMLVILNKHMQFASDTD